MTSSNPTTAPWAFFVMIANEIYSRRLRYTIPTMHFIAGFLGVVLILVTLVDGFETILQPRRIMRPFRFARFFYRNTWRIWRTIAMWIRPGKFRETFLSIFGPLSLISLFAAWVISLAIGYAMVYWAIGMPLRNTEGTPTDFFTYCYLSFTAFFTLTYGDVMPDSSIGRALTVTEAGVGFGFLATMISYLPILYQAFSVRETTISLMDARAGSPPSAAQLLLRLARAGRIEHVDTFLAEWEKWAAELLESHLSFPVLSYYRSQHDNQSWLSTLTAILDTCAVLIVDEKQHNLYQAQLTFAMARHAAVDLALIFRSQSRPPDQDRLPPADHQRLRQLLREGGLELNERPDADARMAELRGMYEPFVTALARQFLLMLPAINPEPYVADNWQRSAWMARTPGIGNLSQADQNEHFG